MTPREQELQRELADLHGQLAGKQDEVELWRDRAVHFMNEEGQAQLRLRAAERQLRIMTAPRGPDIEQDFQPYVLNDAPLA